MYITSLTFIARKIIRNSRPISYYITTPIFYVNSSPHIGHVHTLLLADALNIYHRLKLESKDTIFSSGTDEHGIKIQTEAESKCIPPKDLCDQNSQKFLNLFKQYDTTLTDFVRTSDERHKVAVRSIWNELYRRGFIYKTSYSGWYCNSDETFVPESQIIRKEINGKLVHVDQNENQLTWSSEDNYMFRFSEVSSTILEWLTKSTPIVPKKFNDEAINMLTRSPIGDISISRPSKRLKWGIEVPCDSSQTIYVWLDALTNYLTVVNYPSAVESLKRWPIDCQVIGKDIIKFHALYWPAFLIALSLPLPKRLVCHSHWLLDSYKMSKSRGNVVDPVEENKTLTVEGLRYYLLRAATPHSDTDYSRTQALRTINAELADTYGNLLSRCCAPLINPRQIIPTKLTAPANQRILEIKSRLESLKDICAEHYNSADFYRGIDEIFSVLRLNNNLYQTIEPWKLIKLIDTDQQAHKDYFNVQAITFETIRICSILLQPIVPKIAEAALNRLGIGQRNWSDASFSIEFGDPTSSQRSIALVEKNVLFQRIKIK